MIIKKVHLQGFGKFHNSFELNFANKGIQVVVGRNETGKTTLMQGILAILFGLPERKKMRYKPWEAHIASTGHLLLEIDNNEIIVERDFETNLINCARFDDNKLIPIFSDHDVFSEQESREYIKLLKSFIPVANEEVFKSTTFVSQEQMRINLSVNVRQMLTGSGERNFDKLQESFETEYFEITGNGKPVGLEKRETEGSLDLLQKEIKVKEKKVVNIRKKLEENNQIESELQIVRSELQKIEPEITAIKKYLPQLREFAGLIDTRSKIRETSSYIDAQKSKVARFENEVHEFSSQIEEKFKDFKNFDPVELEDDYKHYMEIASTNNRLEAELHKTLNDIKKQQQLIADNYEQYINLPGDFQSDLKFLRELRSELNLSEKNSKRFSADIKTIKRRVVGGRMTSITMSLITGGLIGLTGYLLGLETNYIAAAFSVGFLFFFLVFKSIFLDNRTRELKEALAEAAKIQKEINDKKDRIDEIQKQYFVVRTDEEILNHLHNYQVYLEENQQLKELETRKSVLLGQLNDPVIQKDIFQFEQKYGTGFDAASGETLKMISEYKLISQKLNDRREAIVDKTGSADQNSDLFKQDDLIQKRLLELQKDHPELAKYLENQEEVPKEIQSAEKTLGKLNKKKIEFEKIEENFRKKQSEFREDLQDNLAVLESEIKQMKKMQLQQENRKDALALAIQSLQVSIKEFMGQHHTSISEQLNNYFHNILGYNDLQINLNPDYSLEILRKGSEIEESQLSLGTRDQLYLALRIAISKAISGNTLLPFFLDDPFVNCDSERLENIRRIIEEIAKEHQVVLFTLDPKYKSWNKEAIDLNELR